MIGPAHRHARGFSLVETMVAAAVTLMVSAGLFAVVQSARQALVLQPELTDLQQRLRVATAMITNDLSRAGAPAAGVSGLPFNRIVPTVLPFRSGPLDPDPAGTATDDRLTIVYSPPASVQTTIAAPLTPGGVSVVVQPRAACPVAGGTRDPACGFGPGMQAIVLDAGGAYDPVRITGSAGNMLTLEPGAAGLSRTYPAGSAIVQVERVTYHLRAATGQLMRYNGVEGDVPAVDGVTELRFQYFGIAADGTGMIVAIAPRQLSDGPWRPDVWAANRYDADLLRLRRVAVQLRLRPAGSAPGAGDLVATFDVSPRNLQGGW